MTTARWTRRSCSRLVEGGVLGLLAFVLHDRVGGMGARATIARAIRTWAPLALIGVAAAVSFGVAATLFDVLAFPHPVYIFLYMAGLSAAVLTRERIRAAGGTAGATASCAPEPTRAAAGECAGAGARRQQFVVERLELLHLPVPDSRPADAPSSGIPIRARSSGSSTSCADGHGEVTRELFRILGCTRIPQESSTTLPGPPRSVTIERSP